MWDELTSETALRKRGWFDFDGVKEIRRLSQTGNLDLYMLQWAILTIELWARQFIDRNPADFGDRIS
jgi:asparagine synthase (glutamine-hydrolysing)